MSVAQHSKHKTLFSHNEIKWTKYIPEMIPSNMAFE